MKCTAKLYFTYGIKYKYFSFTLSKISGAKPTLHFLQRKNTSNLIVDGNYSTPIYVYNGEQFYFSFTAGGRILETVHGINDCIMCTAVP